MPPSRVAQAGAPRFARRGWPALVVRYSIVQYTPLPYSTPLWKTLEAVFGCFTGSEGKHLFHRIGRKGRIWQLCIVRPIHLLRVSLLRVLESNFPGDSLLNSNAGAGGILRSVFIISNRKISNWASQILKAKMLLIWGAAFCAPRMALSEWK